MVEQDPNLRPEVVDLAWEAAQAANRAFDELKAADQAIIDLVTMNKENLGVQIVRDEAFDELHARRSAAAQSFDLLSDMAAPVMLMENSPFAAQGQEAQTTDVPEIDEATAEALEALPTEYGELFVARYYEKYGAIEGYIREGKLPAAYRFPEIATFVDGLKALAPTYEHIAAKIGQPDLEFYPRGLSEDQWNTLLSGHKLTDGQVSAGVRRRFSNEPIDPTSQGAQASLWGVVVIDTQEHPTIRGIPADGTRGDREAESALKALKALPGVKDVEPELIVKQVSPTQAAYRGVQLSRLERGENLLDVSGVCTIAREYVVADGVLRSVFVRFDPGTRTLDSIWGGRYVAYNDVVRASGER